MGAIASILCPLFAPTDESIRQSSNMAVVFFKLKQIIYFKKLKHLNHYEKLREWLFMILYRYYFNIDAPGPS